MTWNLEAEVALATLVITFAMSGVGLLLKYRRRIPLSRNGKVNPPQNLGEGITYTCVCKSSTHTARSREWHTALFTI